MNIGPEPPLGNPRISRVRRRVQFDDVAPAPSETERNALFLSRRFVAHFDGGRSYDVILDKLPIVAIAVDATRVLWAECQFGGHYKSPGNVEDTVQALRRFADFLNQGEQRARIRGLKSLTVADLDGFEAFLRDQYGADNYLPYKRMAALRLFLELADRHCLVNPALAPRLAYVSTGGVGSRWGQPKPREPYSPYIAKQLRDASLKDIEAAVERITVTGPQLAARGNDPNEYGWKAEANVMWAIMRGGLLPLSAMPNNIRVTVTGLTNHGQRHTFVDLIRFAYPDNYDVLSFVTYLALETGLPTESILELRVDCLKNEARGYVDIEYVKRRRGTDTPTTKRVRADGPTSPGAVVKIYLRLSRLTRQLVGAQTAQWLFIGYGRKDIKGGVLRRLTEIKTSLIPFCERHQIIGDDGQRIVRFSPARLRKTHKAQRYLRVNGHLADSADDNTKPVAANHYAKVEALRPLHEAAVAAGLQEALDAALTPIIVDAESERRLDCDPASTAAIHRHHACSGRGDNQWLQRGLARKLPRPRPLSAWRRRHLPEPGLGMSANARTPSSRRPSFPQFWRF